MYKYIFIYYTYIYIYINVYLIEYVHNTVHAVFFLFISITLCSYVHYNDVYNVYIYAIHLNTYVYMLAHYNAVRPANHLLICSLYYV